MLPSLELWWPPALQPDPPLLRRQLTYNFFPISDSSSVNPLQANRLAARILCRPVLCGPQVLNSVQTKGAMEPLRPTSVVRFGAYEVSLQSGEVRKSGLRIKVQQQPMKLLEILLERPGEVVSREELRRRVWPNKGFGDFDQALNIAIGKLRSAFEDRLKIRDLSKLFPNVAIAL